MAGTPLLSKGKLQEKEEGFPLYRKWEWVPQLNTPDRLKTCVSGLRMNSTKKEELFAEISSFQNVYISRVSEILKIASRFCIKRLFYP